MSDLKLFRIGRADVCEVHGTSLALEKSLQTLIEQNLETFLGVRFLASEFSTGRDHGGRMDTLGIDENSCPVIIEYKRSSNMNVINQGLFYLDWLVTHRGDFEMLVLKKLGEKAAQSVEWSSPRLICIAGDFSRYDEHAIKQMNRNIELIRYMKFDDDLLLLEQVNAASAPLNGVIATDKVDGGTDGGQKQKYTTVSQYLDKADAELRALFDAVKEHLEGLGDDVQFKVLRFYFAFKRIKNFACVEIKTQERKLIVHVKVDPDTITLEDGFTRDVRTIGHFGTGDLEITIRSIEDFEKAKPLFERSYENA
jgi:predicted transport protein